MILVDTSVWVDHLRNASPELSEILAAGDVLMHSAVVGELACGTLAKRDETLAHLHALPQIEALDDDAALAVIEEKELMGRGLGFVDVHLLGAVLHQPGTRLWTRDRRLHAVADELRVAYSPAAGKVPEADA